MSLPLERFWRKKDASADKQRAETAALKGSRTAVQAESSAVFGRNHRPSSHSPARCPPDTRAAGPPTRQPSARKKPADHSPADARSREGATAGRYENMTECGSTTGFWDRTYTRSNPLTICRLTGGRKNRHSRLLQGKQQQRPSYWRSAHSQALGQARVPAERYLRTKGNWPGRTAANRSAPERRQKVYSQLSGRAGSPLPWIVRNLTSQKLNFWQNPSRVPCILQSISCPSEGKAD